jgi:hypothetical protein
MQGGEKHEADRDLAGHRWRELAERTMANAKAAINPEEKKLLLSIAERYRQLAERNGH